ncbi:MAG: SWIM zinc finger domain-containing protein [Treponema sp.]|jgi:hypothetical protein|nr:SWIM zinc finger domain-containing protein [Treponema sp.]
MQITEDFIIHFTGNPSTVSNGRSLASKGSFQGLYISEDETLLFGSCAGSGAKPYQCSVDFSDPEKPLPRCSCPSRQIPCKHVAGLLYCKVQGKAFTTQAVPEDINSKRTKVKQREEKKAEKEEASPLDSAKTGAAKARTQTQAVKKYRAQLEGIVLAKKILHNIVLAGLHSIDKKNQKLYQEQIKELGNYYIDGIQAGLTDLLLSAGDAQLNQDFTQAVGAVNYLYGLLKKSHTHTANKIADWEAAKQKDPPPPSAMEAMLNSSIEEQMGYAWKLTELRELGRVVENSRLLQVGFSVIEDAARKQFEDQGIWLSLTNGELYLTKNYRPFKALKYVREEDSFFSILTASELFVYPGDKNPRVRWERYEQRDITSDDLQDARNAGKGDFTEVLKEVKNQIKSPLADKNPIFALRIGRLALEGEEGLSIFDEKGVKIPLKLNNFGFLLKKATQDQVKGNTLVCRFDQDMKTDILWGLPVALITNETVIRFMY